MSSARPRVGACWRWGTYWRNSVVGVVLTTLSVVLAPFTHGFDLARVGVWAIQQQEFTTVALQQAAQPSPATVVPSAVAQPSVVPIVQPLNIEPTARPSIFSRTTFPWNVLNTTLVITIVTLAALLIASIFVAPWLVGLPVAGFVLLLTTALPLWTITAGYTLYQGARGVVWVISRTQVGRGTVPSEEAGQLAELNKAQEEALSKLDVLKKEADDAKRVLDVATLQKDELTRLKNTADPELQKRQAQEVYEIARGAQQQQEENVRVAQQELNQSGNIQQQLALDLQKLESAPAVSDQTDNQTRRLVGNQKFVTVSQNEANALRSQIDIHGGEFLGAQLTVHYLYTNKLQPKYTVTIEGVTYYTSDPYDIGGGRVAYVVYVQDGDAYIARTYYRVIAQPVGAIYRVTISMKTGISVGTIKDMMNRVLTPRCMYSAY